MPSLASRCSRIQGRENPPLEGCRWGEIKVKEGFRFFFTFFYLHHYRNNPVPHTEIISEWENDSELMTTSLWMRGAKRPGGRGPGLMAQGKLSCRRTSQAPHTLEDPLRGGCPIELTLAWLHGDEPQPGIRTWLLERSQKRRTSRQAGRRARVACLLVMGHNSSRKKLASSLCIASVSRGPARSRHGDCVGSWRGASGICSDAARAASCL